MKAAPVVIAHQHQIGRVAAVANCSLEKLLGKFEFLSLDGIDCDEIAQLGQLVLHIILQIAGCQCQMLLQDGIGLCVISMLEGLLIGCLPTGYFLLRLTQHIIIYYIAAYCRC